MVLASVIAGASGGALANVALSPLGGGAGMIQSYWYGAGLILGERDMYTFHWEKIKKRLEAGEDYLSVLESEMNPAITAIANYSLQIMHKTGQIYIKGGVDFMAQLIENLFKVLAGEKVDVIGDIKVGVPTPEPLPDVEADPSIINCPAGQHWDVVSQSCVNDTVTTPPIIADPRISKTANAKYQVSPESFCHGRIVDLNQPGTDIGFGERLYQIESNVITSPTAGGNWQKIAEKTTKRIQLFNNAKQLWPPISYFRFMKGTTEYWALDLS